MHSRQQRKLLILDIDETLLYATLSPLDRVEDFRLDDYFVYQRPHLDEFLTYCTSRFVVAVWTTSSQSYAETVVERLFGSADKLSFLWARDRCTRRYDWELHEEYWVKDLKKVRLKGYRLEQVIVVDDTPRKHERNYGNLVQVREYTGEVDDDELLYLCRYLETLSSVENVRTVEKRNWRQRLIKTVLVNSESQ